MPRLVLAAALTALCGCRQLLGFEEATVASDGTPPDPDAPSDTRDPDGPPIDMAGASDGSMLLCPATYTLEFGGSKYRNIETTFPNFGIAADDCGNDGATTHLVVLGSSAELAAVAGFANGVAKWVGLSNQVDGTFRPVTDEATTFPPATGAPWAPNEPDNGCVRMQAGGVLDANACGQNLSAICECDGFPNNPANY